MRLFYDIGLSYGGYNMEAKVNEGRLESMVNVTMPIGKNSQIAHLKRIVQETKLSLIIGIVLLVLLFMAAFGFVNAARQQNDCSMYLNQYRMGSKSLTTAVRCYAATGNQQYYDAYMQELEKDKNRDIALAGLKKNNLKADEWEKLNKITNLSNGLVPLEENAMEAVAANDTKTAMDFVFGTEYKEIVEEINDLTEDTITEIQKRLNKKKTTFLILELVAALLFLAGFIKMALQSFKTIRFSANKLLMPILRVSEQMTALAAGDLHKELDLVADDSEVGKMVTDISTMKNNLVNLIEEVTFILEQMSLGNYRVSIQQNYVGEYVLIETSLRQIIDVMRNTVSSICNAANEIDSGSGQLATAAEDLANACTSQACQVSDLVLLMTELEDSIKYNEKEAEEAVKIASLASSTLVMAGDKMTELEGAMSEINACSMQITSVTDAISDLADEIEMLSLNASIESARAGEAGRGFAVVAEQVKKLAEASLEAAGQTSGLIKKTSDAVEKGIRIATESSENMEEVKMGAEETAGRINGIVEKLQREVESIKRINDGLNIVVGFVDNNSATSQETAAVSEEQKSQVESMVQLMSKFRV